MLKVSTLGEKVSKLNGKFQEALSVPPIGLRLDMLNLTIYQRGTNEMEFERSSPPLLLGAVILEVLRPTAIKSLNVGFTGGRRQANLEVILGMLREENPYGKNRIETFYNKQQRWLFMQKFEIGTYRIPFRFVVDSFLIQSISNEYLTVSYKIEARLDYFTSLGVCKATTKEAEIKLFPYMIEAELQLPAASTGNWRDLFVYQYSLQSTLLFQGTSYPVSIRVQPVGPLDRSYRLHDVSAKLFQQIVFYNINGSQHKYSETDTFTLYHKRITSEATETARLLGFCMAIPSSFLKMKRNKKGKNKKPYPTVMTKEFHCKHQLKISMTVSETIDETVKDGPSENKSSRECDFHDKLGHISRYHPGKPSPLKFRKVDLIFSVPVVIMSQESRDASKLPPAYPADQSLAVNEYYNIAHCDVSLMANLDEIRSKAYSVHSASLSS